MALMRDNAGSIVWPGRVRRRFLIEEPLPGTTVLTNTSLITVAAGTYSTPSNLSGASLPLGTVTSAATASSAAAIKGTGVAFGNLNPALYAAMVLTIEGFKANADTGQDVELGFQGISGGGASFLHLNGATNGIIRTKNASNVATDTAVNTAFYQGSGGGSARRNMSFFLLPNGYAGDPRVQAGLLEDDQEVTIVDLSTLYDFTHGVLPIVQTVARTAAAAAFSYSRLIVDLFHN